MVLTLHRPMYDLDERMDSAIFRKTGNTKGYYSQLLYGRTQHSVIRHKIHLHRDSTIGFLIEKGQEQRHPRSAVSLTFEHLISKSLPMHCLEATNKNF